MIKEISRFQTEGNQWRTYDTPDDAKDAERRRIVEKYLLEADAPDHYWGASKWNNTSKWYRQQEMIDGKKDAHQSGWLEGRRSAIGSLIKFYPDIISKLNEIDTQKIEEKKDA